MLCSVNNMLIMFPSDSTFSFNIEQRYCKKSIFIKYNCDLLKIIVEHIIANKKMEIPNYV